MDTLLGQQESLRTPDAVTKRIAIDAKRTFDGVADDAMIDRLAHEVVQELWQDSIKVTTFVPVLAMRRIREIVDSQEAMLVGSGREP